MWFCFAAIVISILLGLSLAYYNLKDFERQRRALEKRRAERKRRKALWRWPT